jgi:hypothetical protein
MSSTHGRRPARSNGAHTIDDHTPRPESTLKIPEEGRAATADVRA